jgi:hypothetical protein
MLTPTDFSNPESYEDVVELLVPVLQRRGLMWDDYTVPGGTYRENLLNTPGHPTVPEGHPACSFKYDVLKAKYGDEKGAINIDKRTPAPINKLERMEVSEKVLEVQADEVKPAEVKIEA